MTQVAIICVALAVLAMAVAMILRELRAGRQSPSAAPQPSQQQARLAPASIPPPRVSAVDNDDIDLTKVGDYPRPDRALPRLGADGDGDSEDVAGDSTAMTLFEEGAEVDEPTGPVDLILLSAAAQSDVGQRRKRNEDAFLLDDERSLFVVADGMGGYAGGDVASQMATKKIAEHLSKAQPGESAAASSKRPRAAEELVTAIEQANGAIFAAAQENPEFHGMGTTIVAATFTKRKRRSYIAYAGDSRCYRYRGGDLKLLTNDHTFAAKGVGGPLGTQIRRAVGVRPKIKVDLVVDSPRADDIYLLCSDGLNKMVDDAQVRQLVHEHRHDLSGCARALVQKANDAGGKDNVTVVVVVVRDAHDRNVRPDTSARPLEN